MTPPRYLAKLAGGMILAALGAAFGTGAAAQSTEYRGGGFFTDAQGCEAHGWGAAGEFLTRYNPDGEGDNNEPALSFLFPTYAKSYRFPADWAPGTFFDVTEIGSVGLGAYVWLPDPAPQFRLMRPSGVNTIIDPEREIHLLFEARNWNGLEGCTVSGAFWVRRP